MAWMIELSDLAKKNLAKLDPQTRRRILKFMYERVAVMENPRRLGDALTGKPLGDFWKYRIGNCRVIADIQDKHLRILVVRVGHRRDIYKHHHNPPCQSALILKASC